MGLDASLYQIHLNPESRPILRDYVRTLCKAEREFRRDRPAQQATIEELKEFGPLAQSIYDRFRFEIAAPATEVNVRSAINPAGNLGYWSPGVGLPTWNSNLLNANDVMYEAIFGAHSGVFNSQLFVDWHHARKIIIEAPAKAGAKSEYNGLYLKQLEWMLETVDWVLQHPWPEEFVWSWAS